MHARATMRRIKGLSLVGLFFVLGCGGASEAEEAPSTSADNQEVPDAVVADVDHYSVEFENDAMRLVRVDYAAGEESVMHRHPALCSVTISETSWRMTDADGSVTENGGSVGEFSCNEASVHRPENAGTGPNQVILIELAEGAGPGSAALEASGAVAADPDHYTVEFENESLRVLRIRYKPGETGVLHSHPANCVVWLSNPPGRSVAASDSFTHRGHRVAPRLWPPVFRPGARSGETLPQSRAGKARLRLRVARRRAPENK